MRAVKKTYDCPEGWCGRAGDRGFDTIAQLIRHQQTFHKQNASPSRTTVMERLEAAKLGQLGATSQSLSDHPSADRSAFVLGEPAYNPALKTATGIRKSRQADDDARVLAQDQHCGETVMPKVMTFDDALAGFAETEELGISNLSPQPQSPGISEAAESDLLPYDGESALPAK